MLNLFFIEQIPPEPTLVLEGDEAHHAISVLRVNLNEEVLISDGNGTWVRAQVTEIEKKRLTAQVQERGKQSAINPKLTVLQALPKSDRTKEAIELLVQAGVDEIIPWASERSIAKAQSDTTEKWSIAARAAAKQARRFTIPKVVQATDLEKFLAEKRESHAILVFHESAQVKLSSVVTEKMNELTEIVIVIGPEGGISDSELTQLENCGGRKVQMGEPVFRSAHAGAAALAAVSALIGRW